MRDCSAGFGCRLGRVMGMCLLVLIGLGATGCSSFESDWNAAAVTPDPTNDITGRWTGTWQNENNDHSGPMRAIITRIDDTHVRAQYRAVWADVIPFESEVVLTTERRGEAYHFSGESHLDSAVGGGLYLYEGHATQSEFFSTYDSESNDGTYTMERPGAGG